MTTHTRKPRTIGFTDDELDKLDNCKRTLPLEGGDRYLAKKAQEGITTRQESRTEVILRLIRQVDWIGEVVQDLEVPAQPLARSAAEEAVALIQLVLREP